MPQVIVNASSAMRSARVSVKFAGRGRARVRVWLAVKLVQLAGYVGGVHMDVSVSPAKGGEPGEG